MEPLRENPNPVPNHQLFILIFNLRTKVLTFHRRYKGMLERSFA